MALYFKPISSEFDRLLNAHLNSLSIANDQETNQSSGAPTEHHNKMSKYWGGSFSARLDLTETPKNYLVHADLPGVPKEQVQISVKDDVLTLSGERAQKHEEKDEHRHIVMERSQGKFSRSLRLPPDASVADIKATMKDGVLELVVGKKEKEDRAKTIAIE
ncbi:HSP20-like chaperone [Chytriomyces cf. hyalinus JEL632]|nr:HSP20-like chaperone [Chytriomyces cf. hyalinus JEL632]